MRSRSGQGATYVGTLYTSDGIPKQVHFLDAKHQGRPNAAGAYGYRFQQEDDVEIVTFVDGTDQPTLIAGHVASAQDI